MRFYPQVFQIQGMWNAKLSKQDMIFKILTQIKASYFSKRAVGAANAYDMRQK